MIKKTTKAFFKITAAMIFVSLILVGLFAWQMKSGTLKINQAIPYIEQEFTKNNEGQNLEIGSLMLEWQGWENPLGITATDIVISTNRGPFLLAPEIDANISIRSLIMGRLNFESLRIYDTSLSITKTLDGQIQLTGRPQDETTDEGAEGAVLTLDNLIKDLSIVDELWIDSARVVYRDESQEDVLQFNPVTILIEKAQKNGEEIIKGAVIISLAKTEEDNTVTVQFETTPDPLSIQVKGALQDVAIDNFLKFVPDLPDGWDINMVVDADIDATLDNIWNPTQINAKIEGERGQIFYPFNDNVDFIDVADFKINATQDTANDNITIENLSVTLNEKSKINLSGSFENLTAPDTLRGEITTSLEDVSQNDLKKYWPVRYGDNGAYRWLIEKMDGGVFKTINTTAIFDLDKDTRNDGNPLPPQILSVKGDMVYEGLNIDYRSPLPKAMTVNGTGIFDEGALTLNVTEANIGDMVTRDATLYFDDLITKGSGLGTLTFPVTSSAQGVFDYIAGDPINAFDKTDFKPKNTKGDVIATVKVEIPLLKDVKIEDIKVSVDGTIDNVSIPNAVKGLSLSGGPFEISATVENVKVKGAGQLQGKPIKLDWHEYFSTESAGDYISKIVATVTANDAIRRAFTNDFADYFRGDAVGDVTYIKDANNRDATIELKLDLTQTAIVEPLFGLNKEFGQPVNATLNVKLRNGDLMSVNNLQVKGGALSLKKGDLDFKTKNGDPFIIKGDLKNLKFNENQISLLMSGDLKNLKTNITGAFLDARPILVREKDESDDVVSTPGRAMDIGVDVLDVRTADDSTLKNAEIFIRLDPMGQAERFEMDANLGVTGDAGDLYVRYTPDEADGLSLRVESNNAGETLRAFDLYPYIQGGELQIAGVPITGGRFGDVRGKARINNFSVANAPVLLRLINALSFQSFLQANQLSFARLESDFKWELGSDGDVYTISNGTTSGASVALTFDGFVDTTKDTMEINGTAAPLSELNNIVGKIPLIGQILTGGDALLAATYSIKGDPNDPSVAVNPLSILTPGIIRKMLFESTPKNNDSDEESQNIAPALQENHEDRTQGLN